MGACQFLDELFVTIRALPPQPVVHVTYKQLRKAIVSGPVTQLGEKKQEGRRVGSSGNPHDEAAHTEKKLPSAEGGLETCDPIRGVAGSCPQIARNGLWLAQDRPIFNPGARIGNRNSGKISRAR